MTSYKRIYLFSSKDRDVLETREKIQNEMEPHGFEFVSNYDDADIIASVGGDGVSYKLVEKLTLIKTKYILVSKHD